MRCAGVLALAACLVAWAHPVTAQQTVDYASVSGRVTDPSGAVVAGANVVAQQTETNLKAETVTDDSGRFRFGSLRVGPYAITATLPGFKATTRHHRHAVHQMR